MCNFLSWYEIKKDDQAILLYLTDHEVYSDLGRERLQGCRNNDVLGHGAIRAYFQEFFTDRSFIRIPHEVQNFWDTTKLPTELAEKVQNFDEHWGRMWKREAFQIDDIEYIVALAPNKYRVMAVQKLLKKGWLSKKQKTKATIELNSTCKYILKHQPSKEDLCFLIEHAPEKYKAQAQKLLAAR